MSDTEAATVHDTAEPSAEAWDTLAKATAAAEFTDSFRPPTQAAAGEVSQTEATGEQEPPSEVDTLKWLLAERDHRLDNPDANTEAARHRIARRDAEAQTQAVAARLENMQRAAIGTQAEALGIKPAALWATAKLEDLLDDTGVPDAERVKAAAAAAKEQLGITSPSRRPLASLKSGAGVPPQQRNGWVDAFRRKDD